MLFTTVLYILLSGIIFSGITYFFFRKKIENLKYEKDLKEIEIKNLKKDFEQRIEFLNKDFENVFERNNLERNQEIELLKKDMEREKRSFEENLRFIEETKNKMILEFRDLSKEVIQEQSKESNLKVENILNPFKEDIKGLKEQVQNVYNSETRDRAMLKQELEDLRVWTDKISIETSKLTTALKGDNKILGNWGELILENVLENSGLRKTLEYNREVSLKDSNGNIFRPDVIVNLPDARHIIIDSKTSLSSYEEYIRTGDKNKLKEHISSIKNHIKQLSDKKYEKLEGINSLSFVFMFLPIESALSIALAEDKELFDKAYKSNIFLVSPSTLLMALKTVENTWKHQRQEENVKKIVNKAGSLYDKFVGFVKDVEKLGDQIKTVNKTYESAKNKLSEGNANIVKQLSELKEMGANNSKNLN
jgi:DNA recombination protein RmuC